MKIAFDQAKSRKNAGSRGLPFELAEDFEWETAVTDEDTRRQYPERRFVAIGFISQRLHVLVYTHIKDEIRIISFRKANKREIKRYEKFKKTRP
jgi:hypothetical protein